VGNHSSPRYTSSNYADRELPLNHDCLQQSINFINPIARRSVQLQLNHQGLTRYKNAQCYMCSSHESDGKREGIHEDLADHEVLASDVGLTVAAGDT